MKNNDFYIDFEVAPWALANVCETLYKHGVTDGTITQEDGRLHIKWKYNINRDNDFWWKFKQQKPIDYPEPADDLPLICKDAIENILCVTNPKFKVDN